MAMGGPSSVVFTMKFDPADLQKLAGQITAALGGRSIGSAGGAASGGSSTAAGAGGTSNPSFMSVFKPLAALEFIKKGLDIVVKNSSVANTYLGAMGKVFGAAMDLLLIPFLPIFNLLLVGLAKLVEWLSKEDVQKQLQKIADYVLKLIEGVLNGLWPMLKDIYKIIYSIIHGDLTGILEGVKSFAGHFLAWLGEGSPVVITLKLILAGIVALKTAQLVSGLTGLPIPGGGKTGGGTKGAVGSVIGGLLRKAPQIMAVSGLMQLFSDDEKSRNVGGMPFRAGYDFIAKNTPLPEKDWNDKGDGFLGINTFGNKSNKSRISPPSTGDAGLSTAGANIVNNFYIYDSTDPRKVALVVKEEIDKMGRHSTMR